MLEALNALIALCRHVSTMAWKLELVQQMCVCVVCVCVCACVCVCVCVCVAMY